MTKHQFTQQLKNIFPDGVVDGIYMLHEDYDYNKPVKEVRFCYSCSILEYEEMAKLCALCRSTTMEIAAAEESVGYMGSMVTFEISVHVPKDLIDKES